MSSKTTPLTSQDIERMSADQLRYYAKHYKIADAEHLETDELERALKAKVEGTGHAAPAKAPPKKHDTDRVWFKLLADQRASGDAPVFAAVQGNAVMIHRNKWVPLPRRYLTCFTDAVETQITIQKDGSTKESEVPRYNFQFQPLTDINTPPDGGEPDHGF